MTQQALEDPDVGPTREGADDLEDLIGALGIGDQRAERAPRPRPVERPAGTPRSRAARSWVVVVAAVGGVIRLSFRTLAIYAQSGAQVSLGFLMIFEVRGA